HINTFATPSNNPRPLAEGDLTEIEVTDPTHPLFGRRFPLLSACPQAPTATHVFVTYQDFMVLRIPRAVTNLLPPSSQVLTTLTSHTITELISLAEQCEVLCRTTPAPSGTRSVPHSRPTSAPSAQHRAGFNTLVGQVTLGQVGIILSYDVTRLSRNCSDWYPLLDLCSSKGCLIADVDGLYDPATANGRLLLGLKGTLSEWEL